MEHRPPRPRQDRFEAMTSSIMERITFRSGREGRPYKVAPSSKVFISARFEPSNNKSQKSTKSSWSRRSFRSSGRQRDQPSSDDDNSKGFVLAPAFGDSDLDGLQAQSTSNSVRRSSRRRSSGQRARVSSFDRESGGSAASAAASAAPSAAASAGDEVAREEILSNFVYENSKPRQNHDDDGDSELDDDDDDNALSFSPPGATDGEEEVEFFFNRYGMSDFKAKRRYTLHPHSRFRAGILLAVPFELCFSEISVSTRREILHSDLFVDVMFAIDIVLNFNTAVECDGKLHFSFASIFQHYLRNYFLQDLVWTFPFYALFENKDPHVYSASGSASSSRFQFTNAHPWLYPLSRCVRLLRVVRIPRIQRRLEYSLLISSKVSSLGSFLFVVLALSHVFSCVFSYLAFSSEDQLAIALDSRVLQDTRLGTKYVAAFYWSIMTMTTVGYGDITVKTNLGRVFSLCAMAVGAGVFAYGITNVVSLFQQLYIRETEDRHTMDQVNMFMQNRGFPRKLRDEVRANIFNWRKVNRENKEHDRELFVQMARPIRAKVADLFCEHTMPHRMPFLSGCDAEFVHDLYLAMQVKLYLPGEDIIRQGDYGSEMYFLFVGHAQALLGQISVALFGPNTCFGEFSIVNPHKARLATIQALDFCETHCVDRQTILSTLVKHPNVMRSVHQLAMVRSRKALTLIYESGVKSRTLLQGLAVMWRTDGIRGILPIGTTIDALPVLQEFLPPASAVGTPGVLPTTQRLSVGGVSAVSPAGRRSSTASYNLTVSIPTPATAVSPTSQRRESRHSSHAGAGHSQTTQQRMSAPALDRARIDEALAVARADVVGTAKGDSEQHDSGGLTSLLASSDGGENGKVVRRIQSFDPAALPPVKRLAKRRSNLAGDVIAPPVNAPPTSKEIDATRKETRSKEYAAILSQLQELGRRQNALDERMTEIFSLLSQDRQTQDRFSEQHLIDARLPPLVRDRSQYFDLKPINERGTMHW